MVMLSKLQHAYTIQLDIEVPRKKKKKKLDIEALPRTILLTDLMGTGRVIFATDCITLK